MESKIAATIIGEPLSIREHPMKSSMSLERLGS